VGQTAPRPSLVATVVSIFVVVAASLLLTGSTRSTEGDDDDRPPIIIGSGSIYFYNGDPLDVFAHWAPWRKDDDPRSNRWYSDQKHGATVNSYVVVIEGVTPSPTECTGIMEGVDVAVDYTPTPGGSAIQFRLGRHTTYTFPIFFKHEPVLLPPANVTLTQDPPTQPPAPPRLTYDANNAQGAVTAVTIDSLRCTIPTPYDRSKFRIDIKPTPLGDSAYKNTYRKQGAATTKKP